MGTLSKSDWLASITLAFATVCVSFFFRDWNFDDGRIVYRLVHNLTTSGEWSFNLGEAFNPSTSVLNTVLISLLALFTVPIPIAAHTIGAFALGNLAICLYLILCPRLQPWCALAVSACVLWVTSFSSAWGLETYLFLSILVLISLQIQRGYQPWIALAFLVLARPDGLLVLGMYGIWYLYTQRSIPLRGIAVVLTLLSPWIIFSMYRFGQPFPDTLSVKMWQGQSGLWGQGWIYAKGLGKHLQTPLDATVNILALLCFFGIGYAFRALPLLFLFAITQQICYSLLNVPFYHWYVISLDISRWLLASYFVGFITQAAVTRLPWNPQKLLLLLTVGTIFCLSVRLLNQTPIKDPRDDGYREATNLISQLRPDARSVAAVEVGTIGFYFPYKVLDLAGLASKNPELVSGAHTDYFFENLPDTVLLHSPTWHFESAVADDARFEATYEEIGRTQHYAFPMVVFGKRSISGGESIQDFITRSFPKLTVAHYQNALVADLEAVCIFDRVNGKPMQPGMTIDGKPLLLAASGWSALKDHNSSLGPITIALQNTSTLDVFSFTQEVRLSRVDVAEHLETPLQVNSGFAIKAASTHLPAGTYGLWTEQKDANGRSRWCGPVVFLSIN